VSELPNGWLTVPIGEVTVEIVQREPQTDESFVYIDISSIDRETKRISTPQKMMGQDAPSRARKVVQTEDVLISMTRPNLNAVAMVPWNLDGQIASTGFDVLRAPGLDSRWMFYLVRTTDFVQSMSELVQGALYPAVRSKDIRSFEIPLAPLDEQKRIADKLDALLARVDACRERLDRVPLILKRFRQAVLAAATSGELTEDWREENQCNFDEWLEVDVQSIAMVGTGSTPLRSNSRFFSNQGTPWITSAATGEPFVTKAQEFVTEEAILAHRLKLYPIGTLLVAMYGEGKTRGQVAELAIEATINQACAAVVVDEAQAVKEFVKLTLKANYLEMRELAEGGNQPNLNLSKIKEFKLALPSIDEQQEIIHRVKALFTLIDRLEARYKMARAQVEQLTPALLAKAFRGELVPQDPNDEPASVLLERIRAARVVVEEHGAKPRRRKTDKSSKAEIIVSKKKEVQPLHLSDVRKTRDPLTAEALFSASQLELNIDDSAV
jgi:type I restriction enzyme, S subunit